MVFLGFGLYTTNLVISPFKGIDYLSRRELRAVKNKRTLLDKPEQINGRITLTGVLFDLSNEFMSEDAI